MTGELDRAPTVAEVLGHTARVLRGDRKVELVARAAKLAGLNWGTGRVADLEAGRVSPTLPTLFALCRVFGDLLDRPFALAELFAGDGPVALSSGETVELNELRAALSGQPIGPPPLAPMIAGNATFTRLMDRMDVDGIEVRAAVRRGLDGGNDLPRHPTVQRVARSLLEADYRMAQSVGVPVELVAEKMAALWGRSFSEERDHRAGPDANPQKRGRIARELKAELREAINRGDD